MEEADKIAKLVKNTVEKFGTAATDYAKDTTKIIKESAAIQHMGVIKDVTKTKAKEVIVNVHEIAKDVVESSVELAGNVIKEKTKAVTGIAKETIGTMTTASKLQAEKAKEIIIEKAGVAQVKSKEAAKNLEVTIKRRMSEASQSLKEKTEQQLTNLLANLRGREDVQHYAGACKKVCEYGGGKSARDCEDCQRSCLKVHEMKEEVIRLAKQIDQVDGNKKQ